MNILVPEGEVISLWSLAVRVGGWTLCENLEFYCKVITAVQETKWQLRARAQSHRTFVTQVEMRSAPRLSNHPFLSRELGCSGAGLWQSAQLQAELCVTGCDVGRGWNTSPTASWWWQSCCMRHRQGGRVRQVPGKPQDNALHSSYSVELRNTDVLSVLTPQNESNLQRKKVVSRLSFVFGCCFLFCFLFFFFFPAQITVFCCLRLTSWTQCPVMQIHPLQLCEPIWIAGHQRLLLRTAPAREKPTGQAEQASTNMHCWMAQGKRARVGNRETSFTLYTHQVAPSSFWTVLSSSFWDKLGSEENSGLRTSL